MGGAVILLRPDVPVIQDSRNDLYGVRRLRQLDQIEAGSAAGLTRLGDLGVTCVLVPDHAGLAIALRNEPGWRRVGQESGVVLFAADPPTDRMAR
jgi:hypothetical protein